MKIKTTDKRLLFHINCLRRCLKFSPLWTIGCGWTAYTSYFVIVSIYLPYFSVIYYDETQEYYLYNSVNKFILNYIGP